MLIEYGISTKGQEHIAKACSKVISEGRKEPDDTGGVHMIKWSWRRETRPIEPKRMINPRLLELMTAKEISKRSF